MPPAPCPDMCSEHHKRAWTSDREFAEHQKRVAAELERPREDAVCTASIADRCGGLAELLASMRAAEAA